MENLRKEIIDLINKIEKMIEQGEEKENVQVLRKQLDLLLLRYLQDL